MVFTVTGEVRPENRLFEINQAAVLLFYPQHIKKDPMADKATHFLLIFSTIYTFLSLPFSQDPDNKSIEAKKTVAI